MTASAVPPLARPRAPRRLTTAERTMPTGLHVVAVRKAGVPLVEVRLSVPFLSARPHHPARAALLSDTILTSAGDYDRTALAIAIQSLGASLSASVDADRLLLGGNVLKTGLPALLDLLVTVLTEASYPADEIATERDRLVEKLTIARSRPGVVASEALAHRLWGEHPYARDLPSVADVAATSAAQVRRLHADLVRPGAAVLVIVGDVTPARALDQVEAALSAWTGTAPTTRAPQLPSPPPGGALLVVDRPGSVQSSLRMGSSALSRTDDGYPALQLANLVFGGYFSSRWVQNLREDKGYTYGPHSRVEHGVLGSTLLFDVEVASDVTAPAILETQYELGRLASLPPSASEVDDVRQYAIGTLGVSIATQAGLASTLAALAPLGLGLDWIATHPGRLGAVTVEDVAAAGATFFAPTRQVGVIVGAADTITAPLAALGAVTADA
jgi:predicted Zn-dependent peptidase